MILKSRDIRLWPGLEPDGLPDSRAGRVPANLLTGGQTGSVGSNARTTTTFSPSRSRASEISASKGVYPPSCSATFRPLTQTSARQSTAPNRSQTRRSDGNSLGTVNRRRYQPVFDAPLVWWTPDSSLSQGKGTTIVRS